MRDESPLSIVAFTFLPRPDGRYDALQLGMAFTAVSALVTYLCFINHPTIGIFFAAPAFHFFALSLGVLAASILIYYRPVSYFLWYGPAWRFQLLTIYEADNLFKKILFNLYPLLTIAPLLYCLHIPLLTIMITPWFGTPQTQALTLTKLPVIVDIGLYGKVTDFCFISPELEKAFLFYNRYCTTEAAYAASPDTVTKNFQVTTSWLGTVYRSSN